jgi:hypothetical protein
LREKATKSKLKREILELVSEDKLSQARSNESIMEMLRFGLNEILYKKEDIKDLEGPLKDYKISGA